MPSSPYVGRSLSHDESPAVTHAIIQPFVPRRSKYLADRAVVHSIYTPPAPPAARITPRASSQKKEKPLCQVVTGQVKDTTTRAGCRPGGRKDEGVGGGAVRGGGAGGGDAGAGAGGGPPEGGVLRQEVPRRGERGQVPRRQGHQGQPQERRRPRPPHLPRLLRQGLRRVGAAGPDPGEPSHGEDGADQHRAGGVRGDRRDQGGGGGAVPGHGLLRGHRGVRRARRGQHPEQRPRALRRPRGPARRQGLPRRRSAARPPGLHLHGPGADPQLPAQELHGGGAGDPVRRARRRRRPLLVAARAAHGAARPDRAGVPEPAGGQVRGGARPRRAQQRARRGPGRRGGGVPVVPEEAEEGHGLPGQQLLPQQPGPDRDVQLGLAAADGEGGAGARQGVRRERDAVGRGLLRRARQAQQAAHAQGQQGRDQEQVPLRQPPPPPPPPLACWDYGSSPPRLCLLLLAFATRVA